MNILNGLGVVVLLGGFMLSGCASPGFSGLTRVNEENRAALTMKSDGSLDFEVTEFKWTAPRDSSFVKVSGKARSNETIGHHGVKIKAQVYDENHKRLGERLAILYPTYLGPGKTAEFNFTFPYDGKPPQEMRLHCVFISGT